MLWQADLSVAENHLSNVFKHLVLYDPSNKVTFLPFSLLLLTLIADQCADSMLLVIQPGSRVFVAIGPN